MSTSRPLVPGFLNKLDDYLLKNKPLVWSARTHLVVYYGILFIAALTLLCYLVPDDPRNRSESFIWIMFISVISIIGLVVWLIYLLRFNVFKRFGRVGGLDTLTTFILYLVATGVIAFFPYVQPYVESFRANKAYGDSEIVNDINAINTKICELEYDSLRHNWRVDTVVVSSTQQPYRQSSEADPLMSEDVIMDTAIAIRRRRHEIIHVDELSEKLLSSDSSSKISDTLYVFYVAPEYTFLNVYRADRYTKETVFSNADIYRKTIRNFQQPDRAETKKQLTALIRKYSEGVDHSHYYGGTSGGRRNFEDVIITRYEITTVSTSMHNITDRKYALWKDGLPFLTRIFLYTTLYLTLLIFLFRHSTSRTFFLSMLVAFILTIFSSIFIAFSGEGELTSLTSYFFYLILFLVIASTVWASKKRNIVTGIGINLFVFLMPVFPLSLLFYFDYLFLRPQRYPSTYVAIDQVSILQYAFIAEITGALLLLVLIGTYIHMLFRRWYALPEE
ncbi:MAG: hypothetical protein H7Y03_09450 [Chitinophagaceae bacterium]|nr:hypothetical protein [Chitinophagaceae bacterium]